MKARCITHLPPGRVEVRDVEVRAPGSGEVLVEAAYTCISPGTELRCLRIEPPDAPYIPGYALAGRVVGRGEGVNVALDAPVLVGGTRDAGGLRTHWGGHISHAVVRTDDIIPVPSGVSLLEASVSRMAAVSFHGVRLSRPLVSERVAVVGLGLIGQLAARFHQLAGATVVAADRSPQRVEVATRAGVEAVVVQGTLREAFAPVMPQGADIIVDATGVPQVMPQAIELGREIPWDQTPFTGVRYLVQGSYEQEFTVPYEPAFQREMSFLLPRSFQKREMLAVLDLLSRGQLAVSDLVSVREPGQAVDTYAELAQSNSSLLTAAFAWKPESSHAI